jgi:hypothetical protein
MPTILAGRFRSRFRALLAAQELSEGGLCVSMLHPLSVVSDDPVPARQVVAAAVANDSDERYAFDSLRRLGAVDLRVIGSSRSAMRRFETISSSGDRK